MGKIYVKSVGIIPYPQPTVWDKYKNIVEGVGAQGGCFDGEYFYQAVIHKSIDNHTEEYMWHFFDEVDQIERQEYNEDLNEVIIQRYVLSNNEWVPAVNHDFYTSKPLKLSHANDIAFNPNITYTKNNIIKKGVLVVNFCGTYGKSKHYVAFVDRDDLTVIDPHDINIDWSKAGYSKEKIKSQYVIANTQMISLAYCQTKDNYVSGITRCRGICIMDSSFNEIKKFPMFSEACNYIPQGIGCDDNYIYSLFSAGWDEYYKNIIALYDWKGKFIDKVIFENLPPEKEIESINILNGKMYISANIANEGTEIFEMTDFEISLKG